MVGVPAEGHATHVSAMPVQQTLLGLHALCSAHQGAEQGCACDPSKHIQPSSAQESCSSPTAMHLMVSLVQRIQAVIACDGRLHTSWPVTPHLARACCPELRWSTATAGSCCRWQTQTPRRTHQMCRCLCAPAANAQLQSAACVWTASQSGPAIMCRHTITSVSRSGDSCTGAYARRMAQQHGSSRFQSAAREVPASQHT